LKGICLRLKALKCINLKGCYKLSEVGLASLDKCIELECMIERLIFFSYSVALSAMNLHVENGVLYNIATNCFALREINISGQQIKDNGVHSLHAFYRFLSRSNCSAGSHW
jgi:hypothetical protein